MHDLFLSYARNDDEPFVRRLYEALTARGLDVFFDRERLPNPGTEFPESLRNAVLSSKRLALIVGPVALESAFVTKEWRTAATSPDCIPIIPLLRVPLSPGKPNEDFALLPEGMRKIDTIDFRDNKQFDEKLAYLVRQLSEEPGPPAQKHGLAWFKLPRGYVLRHDLWGELDTAVRGDAISEQVATSRERMTALQGMAGLGKTVMAAAYAQACAVRRTFNDGVFWLTAGRTASAYGLQVELARQMGVDVSDFTPDNSQQKIAALLAGRRALLVLDDVWEREVVDAFYPALSDDSRLLFTTRHTRLVTLTQAQRVRVETLGTDDGVRLIGRWQDRPPEQDMEGNPHLESERAIVEMLKGHTLAVTLAAARIEEVGPAYAPTLLAEYQAAQAGDNPFADLELDPGDKDWSVELSLRLSYEALSDDGKAHFRMLGVIAENASFSREMAAGVWDVDDARAGLRELANAALLDEEEGGRYLQHAVLRAYAGALMRRGDAGVMGAVQERYDGEVVKITRQFGSLPLQRWDSQIGPDYPHIDAYGQRLVASFTEWAHTQRISPSPAWENLPGNSPVLKRLAIPNAPAPHIGENDTIQATFVNALNFVYHSSGGEYVYHRHVDERGLDWLRLALVASRVRQVALAEPYCLNVMALWLSQRGHKESALACHERVVTLYQNTGSRSDEATALANIGLFYRSTGDMQQALKYYEQALPIFRAEGNRAREAATLNNIGVVYTVTGERQKALDYLQQALPMRQALGDQMGTAVTLGNIGKVYDDMGEQQTALTYFQQALSLSRELGDRASELTALNNIGAVYASLENLQPALEHYQKALTIVQSIGDRKAEASILNNIGLIAHNRGNDEEALDYHHQALHIQHAASDQAGEAITLNNIAGIYSSTGKIQQALEYYQHALSILQAVGDRSSEATTLTNVATLFRETGNHKQALDHYTRALPLLKALGDRAHEAVTLSNIGLLYAEQDDKQKALEYYQQALPALHQTGDQKNEAATHNNIGREYAESGRMGEALSCYKKALSIARSVGDRSGEGITLDNMGQAYAAQGKNKTALDWFQQAAERLQETGNRASLGITYTRIASLHKRMGNTPMALKVYEQALSILQEVGDRTAEATTLNNIGAIYVDFGDHEQALEYYSRCLPVFEQLGNYPNVASALSGMGFSHYQSGQIDNAIQCFERASETLKKHRLTHDAAGIPAHDYDEILAQMHRESRSGSGRGFWKRLWGG
jgi:tetratricopeptide (TPR) repeat protein